MTYVSRHQATINVQLINHHFALAHLIDLTFLSCSLIYHASLRSCAFTVRTSISRLADRRL